MNGRKYFALWFSGLLYCILAVGTPVEAGGVGSRNIQVPLTVVYSGGQCFCKQNTVQVKLLRNQSQLDTFFKQNNRSTIGPSTSGRLNMDFSKNAAVAVWMGRKPTAGYRLTLEKESAEIKDNTAYVRMNLQEPKTGAVLAQVITSPCLLFTLPQGKYDFIEILDQKSDRLARFPVKSTSSK